MQGSECRRVGMISLLSASVFSSSSFENSRFIKESKCDSLSAPVKALSHFDDSQLSVESQGEETKHHLVRVLAQLVGSDGNKVFMLSIYLAIATMFPPHVNYPTSSYSAESISTFFHFSSCFQLSVGGQVNISPDDGDCDAGDLDGESRFINT